MPTPNEAKMLTPDGLVNQLFDGAVMQNPTDPRLAARQVISFLANALLYALTSSKNDPVVFLTEALVDVIAATTAGDEAARKELLKYISDMLVSAANPAVPADAPAAVKP
jgi:hypothetical protein